MAKNIGHIQHVKSNVVIEGKPKLPQPEVLVDGELAVNYSKGYETISLKNTSGEVVTFSSDEYYSELKLGSAFTGANSAVTVTDVIEENEEIISSALNDLDERKLDASAYTPSVELWVSGTSLNSAVLKNSSGTASGDFAVAEGIETSATSEASHAEGYATLASGGESHAEGYLTMSVGDIAHAEGQGTSATSFNAHSEGKFTLAAGNTSHAEGSHTIASGSSSHAEGDNTIAGGSYSHAEGRSTSATSDYSHTEGSYTMASANMSHAEGDSTSATSDSSHSEGNKTKASGYYAHAEGYYTLASGDQSHAEGQSTNATSNSSHAEGYSTKANGYATHTEGQYTIANNSSEHASGQFNVSSSGSSIFGDSGNTLFSVGNGTTENARHNAFEIRQNGDIYITSGGTDILLQDHLGGGGSITVDQVLDNTTSASTNPVSSKAVYDAVTDNELVWTNAYVTLSGIVGTHIADTNVHVTAADKTAWNGAATDSHTHSNKSALDAITGNVGTMAYENATSYSSATQVNTALGNKANNSDLNAYADSVKYNDTTHYVEFYHGTTAGTKVFEFNAAPFIVDGMVQNVEIKDVTSGASTVTCLVVSFNTDAGKQDINIPISDIFDASNYYNKSAIDTLVGSGFTSSSITDVIIENEEIVSAALTDLDNKKLDASAYTPTDLSNYYTKDETSGKTEISNALGAKVNSATFTAHTADTTIHLTSGDVQTQIDNSISGKVDTNTFDTIVGSGYTNTTITEVIENMDSAIAAALTDLDDKKLDATAYTPTDLSNYYTKSETSGATEISNALSGKVNTSDIISAITPSNSGSTAPIATKVVAENELIVSNALNDLSTNKADKSTTYTKTEIDDMIGDIESILATI